MVKSVKYYGYYNEEIEKPTNIDGEAVSQKKCK